MNRSVGALLSCACSTSRTTRAIVLSSAVAATLTRNTPSMLIVPAKTMSPSAFRPGTLSPVTGASFISDEPSRIFPSAGIRSPGLTTMTSPTERLSAGTSEIALPCSSWAVFGTKSARSAILARARPAATPSSISPTRNNKTTTAASSVAPISTAPTAATVISVSIENGLPKVAATYARRATGTRPTSMASRKTQGPAAGMSRPIEKAATRRMPQAIVSKALRVRHHGRSVLWLAWFRETASTVGASGSTSLKAGDSSNGVMP